MDVSVTWGDIELNTTFNVTVREIGEPLYKDLFIISERAIQARRGTIYIQTEFHTAIQRLGMLMN